VNENLIVTPQICCILLGKGKTNIVLSYRYDNISISTVTQLKLAYIWL
jgi:hypothetical protein